MGNGLSALCSARVANWFCETLDKKNVGIYCWVKMWIHAFALTKVFIWSVFALSTELNQFQSPNQNQ